MSEDDNHTVRSPAPARPLFTLQHHDQDSTHGLSRGGKNNDGSLKNDTTAVCFLTSAYSKAAIDGCSNKESDSDSDSDGEDISNQFQCRSRVFRGQANAAQSPIDNASVITHTAASLSLTAATTKIAQTRPPANKKTHELAQLELELEEKLYLASCHANGDAWLWDLTKRQVSSPLLPPSSTRNSGPGLTIRRIGHANGSTASKFLYQTRDNEGTVTIHDSSDGAKEFGTILATYPTYSQTFCSAVPVTTSSSCTMMTPSDDDIAGCSDGFVENVIAMPSEHESFVTLRDLRVNPSKAPIAMLNAAGKTQPNDDDDDSAALHQHAEINMHGGTSSGRKDGMLMALSLTNTGYVSQRHNRAAGNIDDTARSNYGSNSNNSNRLILGCGMESGTVYFHDLAMLGGGQQSQGRDNGKSCFEASSLMTPHEKPSSIRPIPVCSVKLGTDPILCLDSFPSHDWNDTNNVNHKYPTTTTKSKHDSRSSIVTIAGMAGDPSSSDLPQHEQGTIAIMKTTSMDQTIKTRIRARVNLPSLGGADNDNDSDRISLNLKSGIGTCHFRPDGRIFATGGWDKRLRVYSRTSGKHLATLQGPNVASITCLDWGIPIGGGAGENNENNKSEQTKNEDVLKLGILAAGSGDGKISIWRAFGQ